MGHVTMTTPLSGILLRIPPNFMKIRV